LTKEIIEEAIEAHSENWRDVY